MKPELISLAKERRFEAFVDKRFPEFPRFPEIPENSLKQNKIHG
jgi:hypothetical protein